MKLFSSKTKEATRTGSKVVATGKRVKGIWTMESRLAPKPRRARSGRSMVAGENQRVRTLH